MTQQFHTTLDPKEVVGMSPEEISHNLGQLFNHTMEKALDCLVLTHERTKALQDIKRYEQEMQRLPKSRNPLQVQGPKRSMDGAKRALQIIEQQLKQRKQLLHSSSIDCTQKFVSVISQGGLRGAEELEKACHSLQDQVNNQQKVIDRQQKELKDKNEYLMQIVKSHKTDQEQFNASMLKEIEALKSSTQIQANTTSSKLERLSDMVPSFFQAQKVEMKQTKDDLVSVREATATNSRNILEVRKSVQDQNTNLVDQVALAVSTCQSPKDLYNLQHMVEHLSTNHESTRRTVQSLSDKVQNLVSTLPKDTDIPAMQSRITLLESQTSTTNKPSLTAAAFDDLAKDLRFDHDTRLAELEKQLVDRSAQTIRRHSHSIHSLEQKLEKVPDHHKASEQNQLIFALDKKVADLQKQNTKQEMVAVVQSTLNESVQHDILHLINLEVKNKLSPLFDKIATLEDQAAIFGDNHALDDLRVSIMQTVEARQAGADSVIEGLIAAQNLEQKALQSKMEAVENVLMTERSKDMENLKSRLSEVEAGTASTSSDLQTEQTRLTRIDNTLLGLTQKFEAIDAMQRAINQQGSELRNINRELNNTPKSLVTSSTSKASEMSTNLPKSINEIEIRLMTRCDAIVKNYTEWRDRVDNRFAAVDLSVLSLESRFQNINTKDMAQFILGQMDATYPKLRQAQDLLVTLSSADTQMRDISHHVTRLGSKVSDLENQIPSRISQLQGDVESCRALVGHIPGEVRQLKLDVSSLASKNSTELAQMREDWPAFKDRCSLDVKILKDDIQSTLASRSSQDAERLRADLSLVTDKASKAESGVANIEMMANETRAIIRTLRDDFSTHVTEQEEVITDLTFQLTQYIKNQAVKPKTEFGARPHSVPHARQSSKHSATGAINQQLLSSVQSGVSKRKMNSSSPASIPLHINGTSANGTLRSKKRKLNVATINDLDLDVVQPSYEDD